ncbi:NAD(P)/FAD-dependent oxidoreductase [Pseudalkalibacillus decolorationis]|uniref:NAD(P)/FAD-dependent oxidoreductase n=1 Tax=Pseudalkalibacillus decolorationis TaxID=163879 RepID=UPI002148F974|nr:FAD-dependent oxidoreductase [Pseudalkalibacillus decolorationis]
MTNKLVLIGGGFAHLYFLKRLKEGATMDSDVTLLVPDNTYFNRDMLPGLVEGYYELDQVGVNLVTLASDAGVTVVKGKPLSIDAKQKKVLTDEGEILSFDVISFDMESASKDLLFIEDTSRIICPDHYKEIQTISDQKGKTGRVVIVGGGIAGVELSFSIKAWKTKNQDSGGVIIMNPSSLHNMNQANQSRLKRMVDKAGIHRVEDEKVERVEENKIITQSSNLTFDSLWWMTDSKSPDLYKSSKLPTDEKGHLLVEDTLQVKQFPFIFGAGESVTVRNFPEMTLNKAILMKQGNVLFDNIKGFMQNGEGYRLTPPKRHLSMLSIGDKKLLLCFGSNCITGHLLWRMKDHADRKFMSSFN